MIEAYHKKQSVVVLSARQTGKSTVSSMYLLWFAMFHFDKTILIASNKNSGAMEMISRIQYAYQHIPIWLKPGVTEDGWNKHSMKFDNESRILSEATSENSGRGMSISLLYLDEFAFVPNNIADEFWTSITPTLATGGDCIMSSTPNGDINIFAQIWRGALVDVNGFYPIEVKWDQPPGRGEVFKEVAFEGVVAVTVDNLAAEGVFVELQIGLNLFLDVDVLGVKLVLLGRLRGAEPLIHWLAFRIRHSLSFLHQDSPN